MGGNCIFSTVLQKKYPYIKSIGNSKTEVRCIKCNSTFVINKGGESKITQHLKSKKHKLAVKSAIISGNLTNTFKASSQDDEKIVAAEGLFAYHTVKHNQSFMSMECTSKILKKVYNPKFSCGRTKASAIIRNVFFPILAKDLKDNLNQSNFVSIFYDSSNHKALKLVPLLVRYFSPKEGLKTKVLKVHNLPGETSEILCDYIAETISKESISSKVIALCADNTNTNFGGVNRNGKNNVFVKLNATLNRKIVGIGCTAHIVHNGIKTASALLPVDMELIIYRIYSYFNSQTVRTELLKSFCENSELEFKEILGYSNTRFLALSPALERILKLFVPLKELFLTKSSPTALRAFFENPQAEMWVYFLHSQAQIFHTTVKVIEGQDVTITQVAKALRDLREVLLSRKNNKFLPLVVRGYAARLTNSGHAVFDEVTATAEIFYEAAYKYVLDWTKDFIQFEDFEWIDLCNNLPDWNSIQNNLGRVFSNMGSVGVSVNETDFFDEFERIKLFISKDIISKWNKAGNNSSERWLEVFEQFNSANNSCHYVSLFIEYFLTLPATNAVTERVFAVINKLWTQEKSNMSVELLEAMISVKVNMELDCVSFHAMLLADKTLLQKIQSSDKYQINT